MKRNETKKKTDPPRKHPRDARVISAEELGTMSKNNLITLVRGALWGIHSLTLIIACRELMIPLFMSPESRESD